MKIITKQQMSEKTKNLQSIPIRNSCPNSVLGILSFSNQKFRSAFSPSPCAMMISCCDDHSFFLKACMYVYTHACVACLQRERRALPSTPQNGHNSKSGQDQHQPLEAPHNSPI